MTRESFATALKMGAVAFLLVVFLFADGVWGSSPGFIGSALREIAAVFRDPGTQWMVFLCLGIYFTAFLFLCSRGAHVFWRAANPSLWLACALLIGAVLYAIDYSPSMQALILLGGAALGQGIAVWASPEARSRKPGVRNSFGVLVVSLLVILLALASVWQTSASNIYGLLMGVGIVLTVGQFVQSLTSNVQSQKAEGRSWKLGARKYAVVILFLFAASLMARGLLRSYSRGAWVAAVCGLAYLFWSGVQSPPVLRSSSATEGGRSNIQSRWIYWLKKNWLPFSVILASAFALSFWQFQHAEHENMVARRAFSVGNANDFSWRNRLSSWEGALQIMAEHPWLGVGWNQPELLYDHYYLPPKVDESAAIGLNDYLTVGATLGVPALICFGMYIWLSLTRKSGARSQEPEVRDRQDACPTLDFGPWTVDSLQATCRAGAIVLIVGFWFDGGLFGLPTAATFWILLGLGAVELHKGTAK
jgi:O-antigen ligase